MTIENLGSLGELVAAIATLITLAYLAVQIRQNTRTVRTTTYQSVLESSNDFNRMIAGGELGRIYRVGRDDPCSLAAEEASQFRTVMGLLFNIYETLCLQHERGVLDEDFWQARWHTFHILLSRPGIRAYAERTRDSEARKVRVPGFAKLVDEVLALPPIRLGVSD